MRYVDGKPVRSIDTVVLSRCTAWTRRDADEDEGLLRPVIGGTSSSRCCPGWLKNTRYLINPTGRFVIGGPQGDCGLTGRKIIVDTYGGATAAAAFSAGPEQGRPLGGLRRALRGKNIVAAGLAKQCQIQVAYAIGVAKPMNITICRRYRRDAGRQALGAGGRAFRCSPGIIHARPAAPIYEDRRLRPLAASRRFSWGARTRLGPEGRSRAMPAVRRGRTVCRASAQADPAKQVRGPWGPYRAKELTAAPRHRMPRRSRSRRLVSSTPTRPAR